MAALVGSLSDLVLQDDDMEMEVMAAICTEYMNLRAKALESFINGSTLLSMKEKDRVSKGFLKCNFGVILAIADLIFSLLLVLIEPLLSCSS